MRVSIDENGTSRVDTQRGSDSKMLVVVYQNWSPLSGVVTDPQTIRVCIIKIVLPRLSPDTTTTELV